MPGPDDDSYAEAALAGCRMKQTPFNHKTTSRCVPIMGTCVDLSPSEWIACGGFYASGGSPAAKHLPLELSA